MTACLSGLFVYMLALTAALYGPEAVSNWMRVWRMFRLYRTWGHCLRASVFRALQH